MNWSTIIGVAAAAGGAFFLVKNQGKIKNRDIQLLNVYRNRNDRVAVFMDGSGKQQAATYDNGDWYTVVTCERLDPVVGVKLTSLVKTWLLENGEV